MQRSFIQLWQDTADTGWLYVGCTCTQARSDSVIKSWLSVAASWICMMLAACHLVYANISTFCPYFFYVAVWRSGRALVSINEVNLRRARLVLGWVTLSAVQPLVQETYASRPIYPPTQISNAWSRLRGYPQWVRAKGRWCFAAGEQRQVVTLPTYFYMSKLSVCCFCVYFFFAGTLSCLLPLLM